MPKLIGTKRLWIGLVSVRQAKLGGVLGGAFGAYVNAIALANHRSDFTLQIEEALREIDLDLVSTEDVETLAVRLAKYSIDEDLRRVTLEVERTGSPAFGIFHTYPDGVDD